MTENTNDDRPTVLTGSCTCGASTYEVKVLPTERFICHCLYCQAFVGQSYTDVTMLRATDIVLHDQNATYRNPKMLPPGFAQGRGSRFGNPDKGRFARCANLDRATCDTCGEPVAEKVGSGAATMVFIPSWTFREQEQLPPVQRHIYDRLHEDAPHDQAARNNRYLGSQLAVIGMVMRVLRTSRAANR